MMKEFVKDICPEDSGRRDAQVYMDIDMVSFVNSFSLK